MITNAPTWTGELGSCSLADLLLWLHYDERSVVVRLGGGLLRGRIVMAEGNLMACEWGESRGELALGALLTMQRGRFTVAPLDGILPAANIKDDTGRLIRRWAPARPHAMVA